MSRKIASMLVVCVLASGPHASACGDFALISRDARFIVLDGDTLAVNDVGNLWWLGLRVIDGAAPGSTLDWALLNVERILDTRSGILREEYGRSGGRFVLNNLERGYTPPGNIPNVVAGFDLLELKWLANEDVRYLQGVSGTGDGRAITLLNTSLATVGTWRTPEPTIGKLASCVDSDGRVIVGGPDARAIIDGGQVSFEKLQGADASNGYQLTATALGCIAMMGKANIDDASLRDVAIIDLAENRILQQYSAPISFGNYVLFASGTRLFKQNVTRTAIPGGGFTVQDTDAVSVIDTSNGKEILSRNLGSASGRIHEQLLCQGGDEKVAVQVPGRIHLLDLNTLQVTATRDIPFDRYFLIGSSPEAAPAPTQNRR